MMKEWAVAGAAVAMLLAGCGSDDSAPAPIAPEPSTVSEATTESPLEGSWQAGPVSVEETVATVRRAGLGRWVRDYRANAPFRGATELSLTIEAGAWDLYGTSGGGQPEPIDYDADYEIDGDTVVFHHSDGSNTYRWRVQDNKLTLQFVRSTLPAYRGIPDEVFQRALYMTETFTRQD